MLKPRSKESSKTRVRGTPDQANHKAMARAATKSKAVVADPIMTWLAELENVEGPALLDVEVLEGEMGAPLPAPAIEPGLEPALAPELEPELEPEFAPESELDEELEPFELPVAVGNAPETRPVEPGTTVDLEIR